VNYRVSNGYYVVDRLFGVAELRLGEKPQTIVRITSTGARSTLQ
jgi:type IV secretion system protein VirB9